MARVDSDSDDQARILCAAATTCGVPLEFSLTTVEDDAALAQRISSLDGESRVRLLVAASDDLVAAAHAAGVAVDRSPVTCIGELELPHWLKEQAVSQSMHRYGRLLSRAPRSGLRAHESPNPS